MHLPKELVALIERQSEYKQLQVEYAELLRTMDEIVEARRQGNVKMELPVDLGAGYYVEGVVPDTKLVRIDVGAGVWFELPIEQARDIVRLKKEMYARWIDQLEPHIKSRREDWDQAKDRLRLALSGFVEQQQQEQDAAAAK